MDSRRDIQESQYVFPYHYLTSTNRHDGFSLHEYLPWGLEHYSYLDFIANQVKDLKPKTLLDAGSGDGRTIYELQQRNIQATYYGIDISGQALLFAQAFNPTAHFEIHDILAKSYQHKCDTCVSIEVVEHIPPDQVDTYIKHIAESLQAKGHLILSTPTENEPTHRKHYQHFTHEKLRKHLEPHFVIIDVQYLNIKKWHINMLSRLLANKYYIINQPRVRKFFYNIYMKSGFYGVEKTGTRIYIHAIKK